MIVSVRCFTCGKVICDKWEAYARAERALGAEDGGVRTSDAAKDVPLRAPRGQILDAIGITRMCCRRHFLSTIDLMDLI
jgi:DNA-directed RNA polymerase subunit N (RpoN/RPB10)